MANTIEINVFDVSERLPSVRVPVLVFTQTGSKYIAARYETNPHANEPRLNQIKWGLLYNGKIIGEVYEVTHWSALSQVERRTAQPKPSRSLRGETQTAAV